MDDLISRQAAIDAYILHTMDYLVGEKPRRAFTEVLRELPPAQPERKTGEWIPCSERLPEESGDYLVTVDRNIGELWVEVDQFDNANESWWLYMDEVTAWMPLPEPYKGEES